MTIQDAITQHEQALEHLTKAQQALMANPGDEDGLRSKELVDLATHGVRRTLDLLRLQDARAQGSGS